METAVNEILPTVVDLIMTIGILYWKFGIYAAVPMVFAFASFLGLEITSSRWNIEPRRQSAKTDREQAKVMHQAVQNWTTVSQFQHVRLRAQALRTSIGRQRASFPARPPWCYIRLESQ